MATNTPSQVLLYRVDGNTTSLVHRFQLIDLNSHKKPEDHVISDEIHIITLPEYLHGEERVASITTIRMGAVTADEHVIHPLGRWVKDDIPLVFGTDVILYRVNHGGVTIVSHPLCANPAKCPCRGLKFADRKEGETSSGHPQSHFEFDNEANKFVVDGYVFVKGRVICGDDCGEKKCGWTGWSLDLKNGQSEGDLLSAKFNLGPKGSAKDEALVKKAVQLSNAVPLV